MLDLKFLGTFHVELDNTLVTGFVSNKAQALLCYLAVTERPYLRPVLSDLLWGDMEETKAATNLRMVLTNLNKLLPNYITITRQTVAFNRDLPYRLDVTEFTQSVTQTSPPPAMPSLIEALTLYQGDFLAGFHVRQAEMFEVWARQQRDRLHALAAQALQHVANYYAQRREYLPSLEYAHRLLALDPAHEEMHQLVMHLLARTGQHLAALAHYKDYKNYLAQELGVEPQPKTVTLFEQITLARTHQETHKAAPLPLPPTPFLGRIEELAQVAALLAPPECRLLTLLGPGGMGKTRLALQVALTLKQDFLHGVVFVPLAPVTAPEFMISAIAKALNFTFAGLADPKQQLFNFLQPKDLLLILDNFEHLLSEAVLVSELLAQAPHIKILVTSREVLNLAGEWVFEVIGLSYPTSLAPIDSPDLLENYSAMQLFWQQARQIQPQFKPTPAEIEALRQICHMVEGMPLALELAATWLRTLSCQEIAQEISRDLDFLASRQRNIPKRHRSLRAVFEQSWEHLTPDEQHLFKQLAIFQGGFRRDAATQVGQTSASTLVGLIDKSFVRKTPSGRYDIHELLRQFGLEKLGQGEQRARLEQRLSDYYLTFCQHQEAHLVGREQQKILQTFETEIENIRLACLWAAQQGQVTLLNTALDGLYLFYEIRSLFQEGERLFKQILAVLNLQPLSHEIQTLRAKLWARQARMLYHRGLTEEAKSLLHYSREAITPTQPAELAFIEATFSMIAGLQGDYETAKTDGHISLTLYQELGDELGQALMWLVLGRVAYSLGEYSEAKHYSETALALYQNQGNLKGVADCFNILGLIICGEPNGQADKYTVAQTFFQQNLALRQAIGDRKGEGTATHNLGYIHYRLKQYDVAQSQFQASLAISRQIADLQLWATTTMWQGVVLLDLKHYPQAKQTLQESLRVAQQQQMLGRIMDIFYRWADLRQQQGDPQFALIYLIFVINHTATDRRVREEANLLLTTLRGQVSTAELEQATLLAEQTTLTDLVAQVI